MISKKNEDSLRTAYEAIGEVLASLAPEDVEKANGDSPSREAASDSMQNGPPTKEKEDLIVDFFNTIRSLGGTMNLKKEREALIKKASELIDARRARRRDADRR